jgi:hypothetical protein
LFLLRDEISEDAHSNALMPLFARNFPRKDIDRLTDPLTFLKQLLLHEIAHHVRKEFHKGTCDIERDCDEWALANL